VGILTQGRIAGADFSREYYIGGLILIL